MTGSTHEKHLKAMAEVLGRLEKSGLQVNKEKYKFMFLTVT